jgi:pSer/pThr/pTyr-binding forkhead associated (FHA) protein
MLSLTVVAPAILAGLFAVVVAVVTARLAVSAEKRKFDRELEKTRETWRRDFSIQYAQAITTNKELAERLSQQFASAFLYIRNPESAVTIPNVERTVTRKHAMIRSIGDGFELVDLKSSAGTFVNGKPILRPTPLDDGASISFGKCEALFVSVRSP